MEDREWHVENGAKAEALDVLRSTAPVGLPESYYEHLSASNGGEGPLPVQPFWLCLFPAEEVSKIASDSASSPYFPGLFVIGGSGAGEAVAFDLRQGEPYPIVAFDMTNTDLAGSLLLIASSFDGVLELLGKSR